MTNNVGSSAAPIHRQTFFNLFIVSLFMFDPTRLQAELSISFGYFSRILLGKFFNRNILFTTVHCGRSWKILVTN
jgi:hypothetical protein